MHDDRSGPHRQQPGIALAYRCANPVGGANSAIGERDERELKVDRSEQQPPKTSGEYDQRQKLAQARPYVVR
jgi:hypothetical protein